METMSVTISDVAKDAGVSIATVSRALNESSRVTEETRQHVLDSVRKLGYVPTRAATSLAPGKTHCIGIIVPDISRWFFSALLEGIEQALRPADFDALIFSLPASTGPRVHLDIRALEGRVDGLILASVLPNENEIEELKNMNLPIVFISTRQKGSATWASMISPSPKRHAIILFRSGIRQSDTFQGVKRILWTASRQKNAWMAGMRRLMLPAWSMMAR